MSRGAVRSATKFFGGRVCLDFANTLNWRLTDAPIELIPDYAAFLDWSENRGALPRRALTALRRDVSSQDAATRAFMTNVHHFRGELIKAAAALALGQLFQHDFINQALSDLPPQPSLVKDEERFIFGLDGSDLRQPLWPILWSLSAVMASSDASRIGSCQADGCGWFFVDESPNHSRLWCSDGCGNRERVRRSYAKRRTEQG